jgi:hypothetical protein
MNKLLTLAACLIFAGLVAGCGKAVTETVEKEKWEPEMVEDHSGHDHSKNDGHNH